MEVNNKYLHKPILISGPARSGTSLLAGIIDICGAFGGITFGPTQWNQKGYFENKFIREVIMKPFITRVLKSDKRGQNPLPTKEAICGVTDDEVLRLRNRMVHNIINEGYDGLVRWYYKGAKMISFWEVLNRAFPKAQWVITSTSKEKVIDSCMETSFMMAFRKREDWGKWYDYHQEKIQEMIVAGLDVSLVDSGKIVKRDYSEVKKVVNCLGLIWKEKEVNDFIDPSLWHYKEKI